MHFQIRLICSVVRAGSLRTTLRAILRALRSLGSLRALGAGLCGLCHILAGSVPSGLKLRVAAVNLRDVLLVHSLLESLAGSLDGALLFCRNLVTVLLEVLLGLEDHSICVVDLVNPLRLSLVGLLIGLGLVTHPLDLGLAQSA